MRPLFHPSVEDVTVEGILHALSDPMRVAIFIDIACSKDTPTCSTFLRISDRDIPKSTLSQHFKALREAGLIRGERLGIEMRNSSRCDELEARFPGLIGSIINAHKIQLAGRKAAPARKKRAAR
jgi:DNA-binding transcriptional ArsR family regulator